MTLSNSCVSCVPRSGSGGGSSCRSGAGSGGGYGAFREAHSKMLSDNSENSNG